MQKIQCKTLDRLANTFIIKKRFLRINNLTPKSSEKNLTERVYSCELFIASHQNDS